MPQPLVPLRRDLYVGVVDFPAMPDDAPESIVVQGILKLPVRVASEVLACEMLAISFEARRKKATHQRRMSSSTAGVASSIAATSLGQPPCFARITEARSYRLSPYMVESVKAARILE